MAGSRLFQPSSATLVYLRGGYANTRVRATLDPFAGGRIELAAVEGCGKCQLAIQDLGAVRDEAEHVGHGTELLFDPFEQGFGRFGGVVDFRGRNAGHR
ncbi:hypothetical protein [Qipengyuania flava]|uniref:hypothetical protein n=1 Tax=Qipengyuania flava TaxID=192812 RepID=UPI00321BCD6F